jgi:hypothetical protein
MTRAMITVRTKAPLAAPPAIAATGGLCSAWEEAVAKFTCVVLDAGDEVGTEVLDAVVGPPVA